MSGIPDNPSESFKRRNPHLYPPNLRQNRSETHQNASGGIQTPPKRIRQSSKPLLNRLEQECLDYLRSRFHPAVNRFYPHGITVRLCNGVKFTPDIIRIDSGRVHCYEVKGPQQIQDDASVKLKMAAREWPRFTWYLVWKDKRTKQWQEQRILP